MLITPFPGSWCKLKPGACTQAWYNEHHCNVAIYGQGVLYTQRKFDYDMSAEPT